MSEIRIDVRGETCPVPLVEVRKALKRAAPGDVILVTGTHPASYEEIPMAMEALGQTILAKSEEGGTWTIKIKR